jgi:hypothetical protein
MEDRFLVRTVLELDSKNTDKNFAYSFKKISQIILLEYTLQQWRTAGVVWGFQPPPPEIPKFYRVEPDCKLSGKCLVFLFQHPN